MENNEKNRDIQEVENKKDEKNTGTQEIEKKGKKKYSHSKFLFILIPCILIIFLVSLCSLIMGTISESSIVPEWRDDNDVDVKPVIYLYPEEEIDIDVKLDNIDFTATYPQYKNGWKIKARPNGVLTDKNNREYNYLYWEGYSEYKSDISEGFVVSKENYISFLEEKLEYVGMSDREICDFISYWLPICNKYNYMLISFQKDYGEKVKIDYSVNPDNELIVFIAFKGLEEPINIKEQDLSAYKKFKREGFVSVEWGGTIIE